jgi:hypothetical protein
VFSRQSASVFFLTTRNKSLQQTTRLQY